MEGWIKIHREIQNNPEYFSEKFTRIMAYIDLNLLANHKEGFIRQRGIRVTLQRGQVGVSREKLAARWQWSPGKVTKFLEDLEEDGLIVQQKTNVINCITLVNYEKEQENNTAENTADETADRPTESTANDTAERTADRPADYTAEITADYTANLLAESPQNDGRMTAECRQNDANKNNKKYKNTENDNNYTHTQILC